MFALAVASACVVLFLLFDKYRARRRAPFVAAVAAAARRAAPRAVETDWGLYDEAGRARPSRVAAARRAALAELQRARARLTAALAPEAAALAPAEPVRMVAALQQEDLALQRAIELSLMEVAPEARGLHARRREVAQRVVAAATGAPAAAVPAAAAAPAYLVLAQHQRSDPQNVHDSAFLAGQREALAVLEREDGGGPLPDAAALEALVRAAPLSPPRRDHAMRALAALGPDKFVTGLGTTDLRAAQLVAARAARTRNPALSEALAVALADCVEDDTVVCVTGRATRVLSALAGVDADPALWRARTHDAVRAEAFAAAAAAVAETAAAAAASADPGYAAAGRAALAKTPAEYMAVSVPPDADARFGDAARAAAAAAVGAALASAPVTPEQAKLILDEALAAF